jgi:hypothetical protein
MEIDLDMMSQHDEKWQENLKRIRKLAGFKTLSIGLVIGKCDVLKQNQAIFRWNYEGQHYEILALTDQLCLRQDKILPEDGW